MTQILIVGDFAPHERVAELIESGDSSSIFENIESYIEKSDYSVINLEAPVVESSDAKPITKHGPNLKCTPNALKFIKESGFDLVTLANNHFYDYGSHGVLCTIKNCQMSGVDMIGGGTNIDAAKKILYKNIKGVSFAFINCCETEFSIATEISGGANPLNPIWQYYDIKEASMNADYVIVIVHGGPEGYKYPTPRMQELYRFFVDSGADIVINHHQHCYSGFEEYNNGFIFYGLGNFCFDQNDPIKSDWNEGFMLNLLFDNKISFELIPYNQCVESPCVTPLKGKMKDDFEEEINRINGVIASKEKLHAVFNDFVKSTSDEYMMALEPYSSRYLKAARKRRLIPSIINDKKILQILDFIICESHLERFILTLKNTNNRDGNW